MANKGKLIIVSGPSGAGKGTVLAALFARRPTLCYSVSATTRAPREGEQNGVQYFFISKEEFERKIKKGEMLEYAEYCSHYYGTPADYVEQQRNAGKDVVLEIDLCGALQVKEKCADAMMIFIMPPDLSELERRLVGRGTETAEVIHARIARAKEEMESSGRYEYIVINDDVQRAADELEKIIY